MNAGANGKFWAILFTLTRNALLLRKVSLSKVKLLRRMKYFVA